jgi:hypothetical protein
MKTIQAYFVTQKAVWTGFARLLSSHYIDLASGDVLVYSQHSTEVHNALQKHPMVIMLPDPRRNQAIGKKAATRLAELGVNEQSLTWDVVDAGSARHKGLRFA